MDIQIPPQVTKYFWGDDLSDLNWETNQVYITQTLLEKGDKQSVSWLLSKVDSQEILKLLPSLKLSAKSRNFWQIYLS